MVIKGGFFKVKISSLHYHKIRLDFFKKKKKKTCKFCECEFKFCICSWYMLSIYMYMYIYIWNTPYYYMINACDIIFITLNFQNLLNLMGLLNAGNIISKILPNFKNC